MKAKGHTSWIDQRGIEPREGAEHKRGLLPRSEIKEAEQWLVVSANKPQGATALHIQFITASQRRANLLQWVVTGVSLFVTVIIGSLGVFSYRQAQVVQIEGNNVIIQRNTAITQRNQAVIRGAHLLATQVEAALNNHQPDLALLLSLKAMQIHDDDATRESLIQALEYSPRIMRVLHGHTPMNEISQTRGNGTTTGITGLIFSPDGRTLLSAGANSPDTRAMLAIYQMDDSATFWDRETGRMNAQFVTPHTGTTLHDFRTSWKRVKFYPGDKAVAQTLSNLEDHGHLAFSPDGKLLAIAAWDHTISVWDTRDKQSAVVPTFYAPGQVNAITFYSSPSPHVLHGR